MNLTMIQLAIQFFKYFKLEKILNSFWIDQYKKLMRQSQFTNTKREVCNGVGKTKFIIRSVRVHFVLTHLFLLLVPLFFTLSFYYEFFESIMFKTIFDKCEIVNNISVVWTSVEKYGHAIRLKLPILQQKCSPIRIQNFSIYHVRKKHGRFQYYN